MSLRHHLSKICIRLGALAALAAACLPASALAQPGRGRELAVITIPQFVATAVKFKALDETGADWPGDDEVLAVFADFNPVQERVTSVYWNVDSGETKRFRAEDRCIAPQPACDRGAHALHFGVALFERDEPPFPFGHFCPGSLGGTHGWYESGACTGDDLIGRFEISLSQADLVAALPNVGDTAEYTAKPRGGDDGSYEFTYRLTRLDNVERTIIIRDPTSTFPIQLQASVAAAAGGSSVTLTWSGATTPTVDIYRNGPVIATTANDGNYVEILPAGSYQYRVCDAGSTTACSIAVTVTVP